MRIFLIIIRTIGFLINSVAAVCVWFDFDLGMTLFIVGSVLFRYETVYNQLWALYYYYKFKDTDTPVFVEN